MAFVPIPNAVLLTVNYSQGAVRKQNTFWYRHVPGGPPSIAQLAALTADFEARVLLTLTAMWHNSCVVRNITARYMGSAQGPEYVDTLTATYPGQRANEPVPGNVAVAVARRSGIVGRRFRGRVYVGSFAEDHIFGDQLQANLKQLLLNFAQAILIELVNGLFQAAIASRTNQTVHEITSADFDNLLDSQRRRLTGRGQ